jgi:hypothetical protein
VYIVKLRGNSDCRVNRIDSNRVVSGLLGAIHPRSFGIQRRR